MARKKTKEVSKVKHSAIPTKEATAAVSPKKAAEAVKPTAVNPVAIAEKASPAQSAEKSAAAAPARVAAAESVSAVSNRAAVLAQIAALRGTDADTARDAAAELGRLGDAAAVEPLIEVLVNANGYFHGVVRAAAASSLAQLRDGRAFQALLGAVSDSMAEASAEAVRALAAMGDPRAAGALIEIVRNPTGFYLQTVRLAAVRGLVQLGGAAAATELRKLASDPSEDAIVREAAGQGRTTSQIS
jgi:HEAT repeat protein